MDATPVPCGQSVITARRSDLYGYAGCGYCPSHSRWYWGSKLLLICTCDGTVTGFGLANPKLYGERDAARQMLKDQPANRPAPGTAIVTGKGVSGEDTEAFFASPDLSLTLIRPARKDETTPRPFPNWLRQRIEAIIWMLNSLRAAQYMRGTSGENWTGRGGSAVWRAERRVELQDFEDWLINCPEAGPAERQVKPPGWRVRVPGTWHARVPATAATEIPEPYATWLTAGRILAFPAGHKQVIWPLIRSPVTPGWGPAPGVAPVAAAAEGLPPDRVSSFIEAILVDWSCEYENLPLQGRLYLPADEAPTFIKLVRTAWSHRRGPG